MLILGHSHRTAAVAAEDTRFFITHNVANNGDTFTIPAISAGTFNATIDWGDGSSSAITAWNDPDLTHTYATAGNYTLRISGTFPSIYYNNAGDRLKLRAIGGSDDIGLSIVNFRGGANIATIELFDTSSCQNFFSAFQDCTRFTTLPLFDTSNAKNFTSMLQFCTSLTEVPLLNTSNGENFSAMLSYCRALVAIPPFDTSKGTNFASFALSCINLTTVPANMFDTAPGTSFANAFLQCALTQTSVDNILVSIAAAGTSNGTLNMNGGTSAAPSATGLAAIATLTGRGWTVTTN